MFLQGVVVRVVYVGDPYKVAQRLRTIIIKRQTSDAPDNNRAGYGSLKAIVNVPWVCLISSGMHRVCTQGMSRVLGTILKGYTVSVS